MTKDNQKIRKAIAIIVITLILVVLGRYLINVAKLSPVLFQLLFNKEIQLKKSDHNINLLLLGIGGGKHEGPNRYNNFCKYRSI